MKWDESRGSLDGRPVMFIKRLAKFSGCRVDLHKIVAPDDYDCYHSHPAWAIRIILAGGYIEEIYDESTHDAGRFGDFRARLPGRASVIRPSLVHRVHRLLAGASYSLWLRGPVVAKVELRGKGWQGQHWHCPRCDAEGAFDELLEGEACPHCKLVL